MYLTTRLLAAVPTLSLQSPLLRCSVPQILALLLNTTSMSKSDLPVALLIAPSPLREETPGMPVNLRDAGR